jgi:hypothetical protein
MRMGVAMLLPMMMGVPACQTAREVVLPNGAVYRDAGHLAGDTTVYMDRDGTVILRNKMAKSWQDFLQAAGLAYGANRGAAVDIARSANRTAQAMATTKAATEKAAIDAGTEALRIEAGTEALRILNPVVP